MTRPLSILAVTSQPPWPLDRGGHLRSYHLLRALAASCRVRLVAPSACCDADTIAGLTNAGIDFRPVPVPPRAGWREAYRAARAAATAQPYVMYSRHRWRAVQEALAREAIVDPPDVWYLDHLDSFVYASVCGTTPFVLDCHNVYSELVERTADESRDELRRRYLRREARLLARMEQRAVREASAVMAVSDRDARHFADLGASRVYLAPNGVDTRAYAAVRAGGRSAAPAILFVGTMSWVPNVSAVQFLASVVLPRVRRRIPAARLRVVGADPTPEVRALAALPGVEVTGRVEDITPYLSDAHVLAVPLEAGGGTRLKILEAFAAGLPVVATPVAAEGLAVITDYHLSIVDRERFADAVTDLLLAPARGARFATHGRKLAAERYDWSAIGQVAYRAVAESVGQSTDRRGRTPIPMPPRAALTSGSIGL
jgi:glycosyltransferase involved in cell wall biosynthesis